MKTSKRIQPIHPGEMLKEEFLDPDSISVKEFAQEAKIPVKTMQEIVKGKRRITWERAKRFSNVLGTSSKLWIRLQRRYEQEMIDLAKEEDEWQPK